ncbi:MAG: hypothetical protein O7F12_03930 [Nitrospirae bacterium]|nr:hypothetical protein [Nitrospirota bacterium]
MRIEYLTAGDVSRICQEAGIQVGPARIRQLESEGRLKAIRTANGVRLFARADIERYVKEREAKQE